MINRDTIWKETYQKQTVRPEGASASISVFTAIHHFSGLRNVSELQLCAELQVSIHEDKAEIEAAAAEDLRKTKEAA